MLPQQYCLRWRYHHSNLQTMFSQLLEREAFCDVTLACEGKTLKAHKIVLSACSTYFDTILSQYEEKDPILIMKDVKYVDIKCLVEFMYKGEINVDHCHLATLLKTAEELRIKGLAEVSWKDDETNSDANINGGVQSALPHVSTVMGSPKSENQQQTTTTGNKRKRGRPPIDDYEQTFTQPKISSVTGGNVAAAAAAATAASAAAEESYSNDAMSNSDQDLLIWEEESAQNDNDNDNLDDGIKVKSEQVQDEDVNMDDSDMSLLTEQKYEIPSGSQGSNKSGNSSFRQSVNSSGTSSLTAAIEKEWPDVIKMNDYLSTGRRQQFWEEPFTKRVMDAIKTKNLEMKIAAELLGVSYGTLYGRYRDAYGCLKHPYRVRDFWSEQGPTDVLLKLKRKEVTLFRAAEQLNVTPQTLSNYLISMSQYDSEANSSHGAFLGDKYEEGESDEEGDSILPDLPNTSLFKGSNKSSVNSSNTTSVVLPNCPDVTVIKKEKLEGAFGKVNNNSDHSNSSNPNNSQSSSLDDIGKK